MLATAGPVDVLVNNIGITQDMAFRRMALDAWRNVLATDPDSVFNMAKPLYEGMIECGWGRIINISPVNGSWGAFGQMNYAAIKAGIHESTKVLAPECAVKGVAVDTISPDCPATRMTHDIPSDIT